MWLRLFSSSILTEFLFLNSKILNWTKNQLFETFQKLFSTNVNNIFQMPEKSDFEIFNTLLTSNHQNLQKTHLPEELQWKNKNYLKFNLKFLIEARKVIDWNWIKSRARTSINANRTEWLNCKFIYSKSVIPRAYRVVI